MKAGGTCAGIVIVMRPVLVKLLAASTAVAAVM
eukprot:CAMPEP_0113404630 /NCGR_PEP_ID=MMETSP0013_2-20120614/18499_1 /TAXON_ID=2843 ORGANISM="Skeletonema costatum, Strain 1716" /NCGR_SAMPLE_ID=MMETSP0013_2 /ASSEMBLY_ACC=CAM_ASM_000158 /LENGTH=32 /DNA_ID=CAMNT_0000290259 /DNA_START=68 /DNA_END=163 /DNA_ORIENTATION=+ /assembly_acc=CAM_ASM_000158